MSCQKKFALRAMALLAMLYWPAYGDRCGAQSRPVVRRADPDAQPAVHRSSSSPRATKPSLSRGKLSGHSVRTAANTQHIAVLAPTALNATQDPITATESPTDHFDSFGYPLDAITDFDPAAAYAGCDSCGGTDACCCSPAGFLFDWTRADLWAGTVGFTVPSNFLSTASTSSGAVEGAFGFQEGFNFGTRLPSLLGGQVGSQLGMRFVHAQLDGSAAGVDQRHQLFLTGGLFRRVDYGVQGGLVVDYLHDDWIYQADLLQLRGELSYLLSPCHELGFRFTNSQQVDDISVRLPGSSTATDIPLSALNSYRGFYRFRYSEQARGQAELQAGWTKDSGAILGLTLHTPLQGQVGLATTASYLLPPSDATPSYASEGWNIGLALIWTPGRTFGLGRDYYRPLFEVADNGSLISKFD